MNARFKDGLALLLTGLAASAFGWALWHYVGLYTVPLMMIVSFFSLLSGIKPKFGRDGKKHNPPG